MTAIEFFKNFYNLQDCEVSEDSKQFFIALENELINHKIEIEGEMVHITMSPARWKEFVEYLKVKRNEKSKTEA